MSLDVFEELNQLFISWKGIFGSKRRHRVSHCFRALIRPIDGSVLGDRVYVSRADAVVKLSMDQVDALFQSIQPLDAMEPVHGIVALLFYKRLDGCLSTSQAALVAHGIHNVFWMDIESNSFKFTGVYRFLFDLLVYKDVKQKLSSSIVYSLLQILFQFYFHYELKILSRGRHSYPSVNRIELPDILWKITNRLREFLMPCETGAPFTRYLSRPSGFADIFVNESVQVVKAISNQAVVLKYVQEFPRFSRWKLQYWTSNQVQILLYQLSSPGPPLHTPRVIRHASKDAMDNLYPNGKWTRTLISWGFRLLRPQYIPSSILHWAFHEVGRCLNWCSTTFHLKSFILG